MLQLVVSFSYQLNKGSYRPPFTPLIHAVIRYWLLFVKRAAACFGLIWKAEERVTRISSRELSQSFIGFLASKAKISTPSFTTLLFKLPDVGLDEFRFDLTGVAYSMSSV